MNIIDLIVVACIAVGFTASAFTISGIECHRRRRWVALAFIILWSMVFVGIMVGYNPRF